MVALSRAAWLLRLIPILMYQAIPTKYFFGVGLRAEVEGEREHHSAH